MREEERDGKGEEGEKGVMVQATKASRLALGAEVEEVVLGGESVLSTGKEKGNEVWTLLK